MTFIEQLQVIKRIDSLIRRKATGSPEELTKRMEMSKASLYHYLNEIKSIGGNPVYCRFNKSYSYEEPFILAF
ncbi:MAG: hypothetical protein ACI8P3_001640 [Saprospiraceae bacterium]